MIKVNTNFTQNNFFGKFKSPHFYLAKKLVELRKKAKCYNKHAHKQRLHSLWSEFEVWKNAETHIDSIFTDRPTDILKHFVSV